MRLKDRVRKHWEELRPHLMYELLKWICFAALVPAGVWAMKTLAALTYNLPPKLQGTVLVILSTAWVVALVSVLIAIVVKRGATRQLNLVATLSKEIARSLIEELRPPQTQNESPAELPEALTPPPVSSSITPSPPYDDILSKMAEDLALRMPMPKKVSGDVDLRIEVLEMIFDSTIDGAGLFGSSMANDLIYFKLRITNHGQDQVAAKSWRVTQRIGKQKRDSEKTKQLSGFVSRKDAAEESLAPDLVIDMATSIFERGKPRIGWVAFEVWRESHAVSPYHATFAITITDAFGNEHVGIEEPARYVPKGSIHAAN